MFLGDKEKTGLPMEAEDTAQFLLFMDELFDSLNNNSKVASSAKPLKGGVTETSQHEVFWTNAIQVISSVKFFSHRKSSFVSVPSLRNLIHTIKGFIHLKKVLISKFKYKYILTRFFNQDPLENFFSYIRSHGVRNVTPGAKQFTSSFKTLIINNFMSYHSPYSNCEIDECEGLLDNMKSFLMKNFDTENVPNISPIEMSIPHFIPLFKRNKVAKCSITYYAGYITKKIRTVVRKYNCLTCLSNLAACPATSNIDFIEAREYKPKMLERPGTFLTFIVSQALPYLYFLIPRLGNQKHLFLNLKEILKQKIELNPINCRIHNLADKILNLLIKCAIYFWCKKINKIVKGQDSKFLKFYHEFPDKSSIDPIKIKAYKKWQSKRKFRKT